MVKKINTWGGCGSFFICILRQLKLTLALALTLTRAIFLKTPQPRSGCQPGLQPHLFLEAPRADVTPHLPPADFAMRACLSFFRLLPSS